MILFYFIVAFLFYDNFLVEFLVLGVIVRIFFLFVKLFILVRYSFGFINDLNV